MKHSSDLEKNLIKVLILEDSLPDLELMTEQLSGAGYQLEVNHVMDEAGFREAIQKGEFEIILADFKLAGFDAFGALDICQRSCPEIPFICVSGSIGEESAIELLKKGAVDYVMKDRLGRLSFTVKRALGEAIEKQNKHKIEEQLTLLNRAVEASSVSVVITDAEGTIEYVNPHFTEVTGYSFEEVVGKNPRILKSGNQKTDFYDELWNTLLSGNDWTGEFHNKKKDGALFWEKAVISPILNSSGEIIQFVAIKEDITERKKLLEELVSTISDKDKLVRELAHRSFNNMQVIQAMLEYKLLTKPELSLDQFVIDISSKIQSMALAQRELNNGNNLSRIDLGAYLKILAQDIMERNRQNANLKMTFDLESVQVLLDTALPLGIAINELLSNAIASYPSDNPKRRIINEIRIISRVLESKDIEICISQTRVNGEHFNNRDFILDEKNKLAVAMVNEQLAGTITVDATNETTGRTIKITFKDNRYSERV